MRPLRRAWDVLKERLRPRLRRGRGEYRTRLLTGPDAAAYAELQRRCRYLAEAMPPVAIGLFGADGRLLGSIATAPEGEGFSPWVGLVVDPAERGKGGGTRLLRALLEEARRRGIRRVALWAAVGRSGSLRICEAAGMRATGRWKEDDRSLLEMAWEDPRTP